MKSVLSYFLTIGWYGYAIRIIANSDLPLVVTIIMCLGGLIFGFFSCINLYNFFGADNNED